jgi:hypothetical protein
MNKSGEAILNLIGKLIGKPPYHPYKPYGWVVEMV